MNICYINIFIDIKAYAIIGEFMKNFLTFCVICLFVLLSVNIIYADDIDSMQVPNSSILIDQSLPAESNSEELNSKNLLSTSNSSEKNIFIPAGIEVFFNVRDA